VSDKSKIQLDICKVYHMDIEAMACSIEQFVGEYLKEPPKGIFSAASLEPVMKEDGEYFMRKLDQTTGIIQEVRVSELNELGGGDVFSVKVYRDKGRQSWIHDRIPGQPLLEVAVPKFFVDRKSKFLSSVPMLPYRGIKIIESIVEDLISKKVNYPRSNKEPVDYIFDHFKPEYLTGDYHSNLDPLVLFIESITEQLQEDLKKFMARFEWHLFFVSITASRLTVEMSVDQRAYLWMVEQERKELNQPAPGMPWKYMNEIRG
jgi:hypothetical protein